jgi:hypothetical protein
MHEMSENEHTLACPVKVEVNCLQRVLVYSIAGGVIFMPVLADSWLAQWSAAWQFPAFTIVLGSSYFQRLLVALPHLAEAVRQIPSFAPYWPYIPAQNSKVKQGSSLVLGCDVLCL